MAERQLRILHVFGRLLRGGAELRTVELAEAFHGSRVRCDFLVLSGLDGPLDGRVRAAGGQVIKLRLSAGFPLRFFRLLRTGRYDVVHSHVHYFSGVILAIAWLAGIPGRAAHFRTAVVNDRRDTTWRRLQLTACRRLLQLVATDLLAVGEGAMHGAWSAAWRSDPRCRVIYSGIPHERLRRVSARAFPAPTIINVASVQPLKNQLRLIRIFLRCLSEMPDLRLIFVGREVADYGSKVRRAIADAGLSDRVHLVGEVDDALPWIAGANLMILPSLWEGLPGAALEGCALGIPVLATDLPGTRELAAHFSGLTAMSLDAADDEWAAAAVRLIQRGPVAKQQSEAEFANSPFDLAKARDTHYEIWSRSVRAPA